MRSPLPGYAGGLSPGQAIPVPGMRSAGAHGRASWRYDMPFVCLWWFVVSIPLDTWVVPVVGTVSSTIGIVALGAGMLAAAFSGRMRVPTRIHVLMLIFVLWSALTLLWTVNAELTQERILTYAQLLGLVWLVHQSGGIPEREHALATAYVLGCGCVAIGTLVNFAQGETTAIYESRYSAFGLNPNDLGLTLSLGIPLAWRVATSQHGWWRLLYWSYTPVALFAIVLTASRGSMLAALVALTIVPLMMRKGHWRMRLLALPVVAGSCYLAFTFAPIQTLARLGTVQASIGSDMNSRTDTWSAGLAIWREHPIVGVGAGAFMDAVESVINDRRVAHSVYISVLTETGIVGLVLFASIVAAVGIAAMRLGREDRLVWHVLLLTWLVGTAACSWESRKVTWLLFALVAAQRLRSAGLSAADDQTAAADASPDYRPA